MGKMNKNDLQSVTERLRMRCSRREYCTGDVFSKALKALEGDREAASQIVETLVRDRYVDDFRYACAYARDKSSISGWGASKIKYMLAAKGVARDVIEKALLEVDTDKAGMRLEKLLKTKSAALRNDPQIRMKLLRFALGRGYSYDEASSVISNILNYERD